MSRAFVGVTFLLCVMMFCASVSGAFATWRYAEDPAVEAEQGLQLKLYHSIFVPEEMPSDEVAVVQRLNDILNGDYNTDKITDSLDYLINETIQVYWGGNIYAYVIRKLARGQKSLQQKFGGAISVAVKLTKGWFGSGLSIVKKWLGLAEGGVFANGQWKPIQGYASGGIPSPSEVFVARESGPELVGSIGGHTGVMNNDQIVASVSNGVAKAMAESNAILRQQNRILTNILAKEFGISSKDIFNAVRSENQNYMNRTGNNAFAL